MFRYTKIFLTIFTTIIGWRVIDGFPPEGTPVLDILFEKLIPTSEDMWLVFWYGIGFGFLVIPWIINWFERNSEYEKFYSEVRGFALGDERAKFFMYLSRAYHKWQVNNQLAPKSLEELIDQSPYPGWLPVLEGELLKNINEIYCSGANPSYIWQFTFELYRQIDHFIKTGESIGTLENDEVIRLHEARQRLNYFWENTGYKTLVLAKLRFRNIRPLMVPEERLLKMLTFLSLALHKVNEQSGKGSRHTYYLCALYFKTRSWRLKELAWNPLVENGWDRLRM